MDFRTKTGSRKMLLAIGLLFLLVLQCAAVALNSCNIGVACADDSTVSGGANIQQIGASSADVPPEEVVTQPTEEDRTVVIPMLINTENVMSADFAPINLVEIGNEVKGTATIKINATVFAAYKVMYADMGEAGVLQPSIISGYRSYAKQKQLYDAKVAQYGTGQKVTAVPGTSEHQYSACIDLSTDGTCQNNFGELPTGIWIAENSYKYGFVIRYPEGKKEKTGINFEPWHIRYVGVEHATAMHNLDMCLEEYVVYLREQYPNAIAESSPDDFPAPRWAGDVEGEAVSTVQSVVSDTSTD